MATAAKTKAKHKALPEPIPSAPVAPSEADVMLGRATNYVSAIVDLFSVPREFSSTLRKNSRLPRDHL